MKFINPERFQRLMIEAQNADFSGWDFRWLAGRMVQEDPPWDYPDLVKKKMSKVDSMLDLGTGGGELLAYLTPLPADTHATESYPPNQRIAKARLTPLGITLHETREDEKLPFPGDRFDLVIARHESYDPDEVYRVLKKGGIFITQQVGGLDNLELNQALEKKISFPFTDCSLVNSLTDLYSAGFQVDRAEKAALPSIFKDIGAVFYYLKAIPWQVPGFSPDTHKEGLIRLHNIIERQDQFVATAHRFLIIARKMEI
ncbi:MAG: class I SAM-dependent methyltransferase [Brevefilum sp.]